MNKEKLINFLKYRIKESAKSMESEDVYDLEISEEWGRSRLATELIEVIEHGEFDE